MSTTVIPLSAFTPAELEAWGALEDRWAELLAHRRQELRIPEIEYQPTDDDVMVFRTQAKEQQTEGGIVIPTFVMEKDVDERTGHTRTQATEKVVNIGLLLEAGCAARDWMRSHGVLVGDFVKWGRFSGQEENAHWFSGGKVNSLADVLLLNVRDLRGSFDLDARLRRAPAVMRRVFVADVDGKGLHVIKPVVYERSA